MKICKNWSYRLTCIDLTAVVSFLLGLWLFLKGSPIEVILGMYIATVLIVLYCIKLIRHRINSQRQKGVPYWLSGGVATSLIPILFGVFTYICLISAEVPSKSFGFECIPFMFPLLLASVVFDMHPDLISNHSGFLLMLITNVVLWFVVGAAFGTLVEIIQKRTR